MARRFASFAEFYPHYLAEHAHPTSRRLHFAGTSLVIALVGIAVATRSAWWLAGAPLAGYGFAWIGHFAFEKNRPATFSHPLYSLAGDFRMWWQMLAGHIARRDRSARRLTGRNANGLAIADHRGHV